MHAVSATGVVKAGVDLAGWREIHPAMHGLHGTLGKRGRPGLGEVACAWCMHGRHTTPSKVARTR